MNLTPDGLNALLAPATGFVLWFRPTKREPWRMHSQHRTELDAVCAMSGSGMWLILEAGREP